MDTYRGPVSAQLKAELRAVNPECCKRVFFQPRGRGPLFNPTPSRLRGKMADEGRIMETHMDRHAVVDQEKAASYVARLCSDQALRPPPEDHKP